MAKKSGPQRRLVTFTVDEGERYKFGKIDVNIKLKDLPKDQVLPLLLVHEDDWYDANAVERSISVPLNSSDQTGVWACARDAPVRTSIATGSIHRLVRPHTIRRIGGPPA